MDKKRFPSFSQWKQIFKVFDSKEKKIFLLLSSIALISGLYVFGDFYLKNTKIVPAAGGTFVEGVIGQPRFINPIYGETNDVDRSLIDLIYSGITKYDKDGNIVNDLIESYQVSDDGKTYAFKLKENLFWQDGQKLTADDVIFTIKTIQNSDYKSPLRANWLNVEVEKADDRTFIFRIGSAYNSFLENCTVKIIPQHIWKNILPENFSLSSYNLQPVGSGPYLLRKVNQDSSGFINSIELSSNAKYYNKPAFIGKITFKFFGDKNALIEAINKKLVDGFSLSSINGEAEKIKQNGFFGVKFNTHYFAMPRYFAVFFNTQKPGLFSDINIAKALEYSVNKTELLEKINSGELNKAYSVDSPILPDYFGLQKPSSTFGFNVEEAKKLLEKSGYIMDESGKMTKKTTKQPAFQFRSYLKQGSKNNEVAELKSCLIRLGDAFDQLLKGKKDNAYDQDTENAVTEFQKKYLPDAKPTGETGTGTRQKLNELCFGNKNNISSLEFEIITINQPQLVKTAEILRDFWQKIGVTATVKALEFSELKETIKNRDYNALLYGQALSSMPDLYPFWHSTQLKDPGLNLSSYENKEADKLLKEARETLDNASKIEKYQTLQNQIIADAPALFLYNFDYGYFVSQKIRDIDTKKIVDPAKRFSNIENWHIKTKRAWK